MEIDILDRAQPPDVPVHRLADGVRLLGEYEGSAFDQPRYLVQRADGQTMTLPGLLYRVLASLDGRSGEQIAAELSAGLDEPLTAEEVRFLIEERLAPVGLVRRDAVDGEGLVAAAQPGPPVAADPLLALRHRVAVVPERIAWRIAGVFRMLFLRPVWLALVLVFMGVDVLVVLRGSLLGQALGAVEALVAAPVLILAGLALTVVSGAFHECGHITACRYGGARPGAVGVGLYIVWPSFYSTVTDSYRLGRRGRLRTDLGGVYFDAVFMSGVGLAYLLTGQAWLLAVLIGMHVEAAWQLVPSLRLDGYYILADLIGVPDLFGYVPAALLSLVPGRGLHPRLRALRRTARRALLLWTSLVVPVLGVGAVAFLVAAPAVLPTVWAQMLDRLQAVVAAARAGAPVAASLEAGQLLLLLLPWLGVLLLLWSTARLLLRRITTRRNACPTGTSR